MRNLAILAAAAAIVAGTSAQAANFTVDSLPYSNTVIYTGPVHLSLDNYTFTLTGTEDITSSITSNGISGASETLYEQGSNSRGKTTWTEVAGGLFSTSFSKDLSAGTYKLVAGSAGLGKGSYTANISAVPIPAALPLFGSALVGLVAANRRRRRKAEKAA